MRRKICLAVTSRKMVSFHYDGGTRLVEPFCYGIHKSTGNEVLRGYQVGGFSRSGKSVGWRLFKVGELSGLVITGQSYSGVRKDYNSDDYMMKKIICRIEKEKPHKK